MAHIIVIGNEKGGSGKSTIAMHIVSALMLAGKQVGVIDLDLRQSSLLRYLDNRADFAAREKLTLPMPRRYELAASNHDSKAESADQEEDHFTDALVTLEKDCSFILIDCPGSHSHYSQMAHAAADTLITPMNDSMIDFDLLARIDPASGEIKGPSVYSEIVWKARQLRNQAHLEPLDWVVLRHRLASLEARNKKMVGQALEALSTRIGFRLAPGFSERVIFRELFNNGLTLIDLKTLKKNRLTMSNIAARHELRDLVKTLNLPDVAIDF